MGLARVSAALANYENALATLQSAASIFPDHYEIQYQLGEHYRKRSQFPEAAACFQKAIQIDKEKSKAYKALGNIQFDMQKYDGAISHLEFFLTKHPADFKSNMQVAYIHVRNGSPERALPFYRRAVESNPASIDARIGLASVLEELGRPQAAARTYKEIIDEAEDVSPLEPVILALANLYNLQNEFDRTISLLESLFPEAPPPAGLSCALGIAYAGEGDYAQAVDALERAAGHPKWGTFATNQLNKIKKLKSLDSGE